MEYTKDSNICRKLTFDKTKKLNGHEVKLATFLDIKNIPHKNLSSEMTEYLKEMKQKGSMTVYETLSLMEAKDNTWFFSSSAKITSFKNGYFRQLADKTIDALDKSFQLADTNFKYMDILTRYDVISYSILTKKSNYLTTISQVACNYQFLFLTIIMLMLIGMIIIINNKFDISSGILDVMSLTAGMGVITPLDRLSMRIIYIFGFLFVFTVMPEFQGQVSAILSEPLRRNVESLKDLHDNNYHVYFDAKLVRDIVKEKLWVTDEDMQYLHPSNYSELNKCAVEAEFNSTVACILFRSTQQWYASITTNLHVSRDVIFEKYFVNWVRKDWSLKDKLDRVSSWTTELGFHYGRLSQSFKYYTKKLRDIKRIEERASFEFIDFDTLILSYMIVLGLSIWGLVAFGLELLFHNYEKRRRQTLIRRRFRMELRSQLRNVSSIEQIIPSNPRTSFGG
ncbi:GSCOCG00006086001-RA-CDS [Cotesia congregata]|nr:GSCOCG00006086001-RA-CDS [Cotesia congregata]